MSRSAEPRSRGFAVNMAVTRTGTVNRTMARTVAVRVLAAGTAATLAMSALSACSVQTAGAPKGHLTVSATFDDVQSLVVGHSVQLSDVRIGTVTGIRLDGYRAKVTMSIADGQRLPSGVTASVAKTSLLGENYIRLDLPPGTNLTAGPFLPNGGVIARTSVQPDLEQITERVGPLLAALGGQDLASITEAGSTALAGKGKQLNRMIQQATEISDSYAAASDDLVRALDGLAELGHTLADGSDQLGKLPGNIALATGRLQKDRAEIKRSVLELRHLGTAFNKRVQHRHAVRLVKLLKRTDSILAAAVRGKEDIKTLAQVILQFLRSPSASSGGQGLMYVWLRGFLPVDNGVSTILGTTSESAAPLGSATDPSVGAGASGAGGGGGGGGGSTDTATTRSLDLQRLMGPR